MYIGKKFQQRLAVILALLSLLLTLSFSRSIQAAQIPSQLTITPTPLLVNIEYRGGLCRYGPCYERTSIYIDGSFIHSNAPDSEFRGTLDAVTMTELFLLIETTDFKALRAVKFTGECPTAYDGQETIYTFYWIGGTEVISNCQFVIDFHNPLFQKIDTLLPRIGTPAPPHVTRTPTATAELPLTPMEALLRKIATRLNCGSSRITIQHKGSFTTYSLDCTIAAAQSVTILLEPFDTEADAQRAFKPVAGALPTDFHGYPAATAVLFATENASAEYMIIQAQRLLITVTSHLERSYGTPAKDAAETIYQVSQQFGLAFQAMPTAVSTSTPIP